MFTKSKTETNGDISLIPSVSNESNPNLHQQHITVEKEDKLEDNIYSRGSTDDYNDSSFSIWRGLFYIIVLPTIYIFLIVISYLNTSNAFHVFSWFATVFSISYILCIIHTLAFSTHLCHHTIDYTFMTGVSHNYIPHKVHSNNNKPWNSISQMSHIRGSSVYKWHTVLMSYGSFSIISGAIIKLFQLESNTALQTIAVYCLLCGGIGGLILANFEVYLSPSFSRILNLCSDGIHTFGALCYAILGNIAFAMYNDFNFTGCCLVFSTILILVFYRINRIYQYRKKVNEHEKWVHNMSRINIGLEITAIIPSAISMCGLVYQFGNEMLR